MAVGQSSRARPSATMDDGARPPLDMNMVMMMMMHQYLGMSMEMMNSFAATPAVREPMTLVDLHNHYLRRERKRPRPSGTTRRGRYENKVHADGQPFRGMQKFKLDHTSSTYWQDYLSLKDAAYYDAHPSQDVTLRRSFESAIRMPLSLFQRLAEEMSADPFFQERSDLAVPLKVKLAASLRFLALGVAWPGMEEIFKVSRVTLRAWFHNKFLPWMMKQKYPAFVKYPKTPDELAAAVKPFERAGFPGMCGLSDGVHVKFTGYNSGVKFKFVGAKKYPTVVWNVSVDYDGQPISVSIAAPGSTNDKTLAASFDSFLRDVVRSDPLYTNFEFKIASQRGTVTTRGAVLGVDGGYQNYREFIAPYDYPAFGTWQYTWSKGFESLRKKVECFFGRVKKQFRILVLGIYMTNLRDVDHVFKVCCCLCNMRHAELHGNQETPDDWRQVDEEDLRRLYADAWKGHVPEEEEEEQLNDEDPNSQQAASERRAEDGEPELNLDTMHGLRVALVHHYKLHKTRLREVAGDARGWLGADANQIVREAVTFL